MAGFQSQAAVAQTIHISSALAGLVEPLTADSCHQPLVLIQALHPITEAPCWGKRCRSTHKELQQCNRASLIWGPLNDMKDFSRYLELKYSHPLLKGSLYILPTFTRQLSPLGHTWFYKDIHLLEICVHILLFLEWEWGLPSSAQGFWMFPPRNSWLTGKKFTIGEIRCQELSWIHWKCSGIVSFLYITTPKM